MRMTSSLAIAAAALLAVSPALAQNAAGPTNTTDVTSGNAVGTSATTTNDVSNGTTAVGGTTSPGGQDAALPATAAGTPADVGYVAPAQEQKKGFPWGVLGLLGLLGLIPRRGR
jgi:hypothetical protein